MSKFPEVAFSAGELAPAMYGRMDLDIFRIGLSKAENCFVVPQGGLSNRAGTTYVAPQKFNDSGARPIPFIFSTSQAYVLEFGETYMRVIRAGGMVLDSTSHVITAATNADPVVITSVGHGIVNDHHVFITDVTGMIELNDRFFKVANATANTFELLGVDGSNYGVYAGGGTVEEVYEIVSPYAAADLPLLTYDQSADVMWLDCNGYPPYRLTRTADDDWKLIPEVFEPEVKPPTGLVLSGVGASSTQTYRVQSGYLSGGQVTVNSIFAEGSDTKNPPTAIAPITITWVAPVDPPTPDYYDIFWLKNGVSIFVGRSTTLAFIHDGTMADRPTSQVVDNPLFGGGQPGAVALHDQRLYHARTDEETTRFWGSRIGDFVNMTISDPVEASSSISHVIVAKQVNEIRHMLSLDSLLVFTAGAEFTVDFSNDPLIPTIKTQTYHGISNIPPLIIGKDVLFIQDKGERVHSFFSNNDVNGFTSSDRTLEARHLFEGQQIVGWAYQKVPFTLVWAVRSDGTLLSMMYAGANGAGGWTRHTTIKGEFEDVMTIPEGEEDAVYFFVKRVINGETIRTIERLHSRFFTNISDAFFVDNGLTYTGAPTTEISNLWHLEGEEVAILGDGDKQPSQVVQNGKITLQEASSLVHVGLPIISAGASLPLSWVTSQGTTVAKKKLISRITLRVQDTRGLKAGSSIDNVEHLVDWLQRSDELWGEPTRLFTGEIDISIPSDWGSNGIVHFRQEDPLPFTIQQFVPEVKIGG